MSQDESSIHILRKVVVDCFLLVLLGLAIFGTTSIWIPFERGFFCGDESLMFPYRHDTVTSVMLKVYGLVLPFLAFLICEWALLRRQNSNERCLGFRVPAWLRGFYAAAVSFAFGVCVVELTTNVAKNIIGRPRPHFFDLCKPSVDCTDPQWQHRYIQSHEYHCTGHMFELFKDMRMSFISGHSSWSAFTMVYLALYLEKRMIWSGTRLLRHTLQFSALMLSWFTALTRVSDYKHHWSDVLAGYTVGAALAVLLWTWGTDLVKVKKEHAPLPQNDLNLSPNHITAQSA